MNQNIELRIGVAFVAIICCTVILFCFEEMRFRREQTRSLKHIKDAIEDMDRYMLGVNSGDRTIMLKLEDYCIEKKLTLHEASEKLISIGLEEEYKRSKK